jgi:glycine/D-amino acid oxidase-like deaminating enzyme
MNAPLKGTTMHSNVVVIGGGVFGASTAYYLARKGGRDIMLLEAREVGSQTSSQAAGLIRSLRGSAVGARMALYSIEAFERFPKDIGHDIAAQQSGAYLVALSDETAAQLQRWTERAQRFGVTSTTISLDEARARFPLLQTRGVRSIVYEPRDLYLEPAEVAVGFAKGARGLGVEVQEHTPVRGIEVAAGKIIAVRTDHERITTRWVVLAGGAWGPQLAAQCGIFVPTIPVRHQLHITTPLDEVRPEFPIVRFPELAVYLRPAHGGLMVGGYESNPTSYDPQTIGDDLDVRRLVLDRTILQHFTEAITRFCPVLDRVDIAREQRGLPTMAPDGFPVLGQVPGVEGLLLASGDNVGGVSISPAVGHLLSELILTGTPAFDLSRMAVDRFGRTYDDPQLLRRACEARYAAHGRGYIELVDEDEYRNIAPPPGDSLGSRPNSTF